MRRAAAAALPVDSAPREPRRALAYHSQYAVRVSVAAAAARGCRKRPRTAAAVQAPCFRLDHICLPYRGARVTIAPSRPCSPLCRATELFDWIRALDDGHPLQSLLDVYSYTAMISLCITEHDVDRALKVRPAPAHAGWLYAPNSDGSTAPAHAGILCFCTAAGPAASGARQAGRDSGSLLAAHAIDRACPALSVCSAGFAPTVPVIAPCASRSWLPR